MRQVYVVKDGVAIGPADPERWEALAAKNRGGLGISQPRHPHDTPPEYTAAEERDGLLVLKHPEPEGSDG